MKYEWKYTDSEPSWLRGLTMTYSNDNCDLVLWVMDGAEEIAAINGCLNVVTPSTSASHRRWSNVEVWERTPGRRR